LAIKCGRAVKTRLFKVWQYNIVLYYYWYCIVIFV
jgi:hypothetical protein